MKKQEVIRMWDIEAWISIRQQLGLTIRELHRALNKHVCDNRIPYRIPTHIALTNRLDAGHGPQPELQKILEAVLHLSLEPCWIDIKNK